MTLTAMRPGPRTLQIALWTALLALLLEIGPGAHAAAPNADSPDASAPAAKRQSDPDIVFHFDFPAPFHVGIKHGCRAATKGTPIFSDS